MLPSGNRLGSAATVICVMVMNEADNRGRSLLGLAERTATAALSFADHLRALLACGNPVAVAFEHFLGDPADDGVRVFRAVKLLSKLRFELFDVRHVRIVVG